MPDYKAMRGQARAVGRSHGKAMDSINKENSRQQRKAQLEARFAELAMNKEAQQNEIARSQWQQSTASATEEQAFMDKGIADGLMEADGTYKPKYWEQEALVSLKDRGVTDVTQVILDAEAKRLAGGAAKGYSRKYDSKVAMANYQELLRYNSEVRTREESRKAPGSPIERLASGIADKVFGREQEEEIKDPNLLSAAPGKQFEANADYTGSIPAEAGGSGPKLEDYLTAHKKDDEGNIIPGQTFRIATDENTRQSYILEEGKWNPLTEDVEIVDKTKTETKRQNLQQVNVEGMEGNFWLDPINGQIRGPGTNGWVSAENLSTIPQDRSPITVAYTDMKTGEEMKGTLIETFPGDEEAVMKRGGKYFATVSTPVKLRGTQDQHSSGKGLTKQQNKDLGYRDSAFNVQSLSTEMLNQDYQGNPAGWVAARMSTIGDMFGSVIPDLDGTENDLPAIIDYIKSNVSEDAKASQELGILDARAVAEGNVVAINKLLSYGTALWMNGGTRITTKVSEDAAEISEAWISGTAQHKGKLASLRNQASKSYARNASRHLNFARQDDTNEMWSQYPTASRKHKAGWDFAIDKAEGNMLKRQLAALKKKDPEAYRLSVESLEGTMSSMDTIETPIFWSSKFQTNVMLYHKTDPKTGAIRFATFKTE